MKNTETGNGFSAVAVLNRDSKQFGALSYLKNQLIFLERLTKTLETSSRAFFMVDMQIANLKAVIEELGHDGK